MPQRPHNWTWRTKRVQSLEVHFHKPFHFHFHFQGPWPFFQTLLWLWGGTHKISGPGCSPAEHSSPGRSRSFQLSCPSMDRISSLYWGVGSRKTTWRQRGQDLRVFCWSNRRLILKVCLLSVHVTFYLRGKVDFPSTLISIKRKGSGKLLFIFNAHLWEPRPNRKKLP